LEGRDKVTGLARYAADFEVPDVCYAVLVQSGVSAGRVTVGSLETSAKRATAAPG